MAASWQRPEPPPADLTGDVMCLWRATIQGTHRLVPDGCVDMLWLDTGRVVLCGPERRSWEFTLPAGMEAVGVRFAPGVAARVFRTSMDRISDRRIALADVLGSRTERMLSEQLGEAPDPVGVLAHQVRGWLDASDRSDTVDMCLARALLAPGGLPAGTIAREVGLSARQMQRRSARLFGYGPTTLTRLVRFQRFIHATQRHPAQSLASAAATAGYYDQAHVVRDCRTITGLPPSSFLATHDRTFPDAPDPYGISWDYRTRPVARRG